MLHTLQTMAVTSGYKMQKMQKMPALSRISLRACTCM